MIIKYVIFADNKGREFRIPLNLEISKDSILDIANDIIAHLWLEDDEEKPTAEVVFET